MRLRRLLNRGVRFMRQRYDYQRSAHGLRAFFREHIGCDDGCAKKSEILRAAWGRP